ncbi:hypothetical protein [Paractinoplanes brasiliensis]|uniref:Uncharacterized protein n=1 Tax=Paractinoplanes brasiliensis TaxID=52695 RepID=A0A4R6J8J1_9ACTN|nr:hypothetical protein [Actinoplanes brasiliensis]TDO31910.1 hypothetical protein C8E87_7348 [Actinoplanes brasiliensis]GID27952.1 hypothetical protein Abr02nite_29350 [Actinoplanes brasiliensis]
MSDAEFLAYAGSLAAAGLLFLILAVLGLGQGVVLRVVDVLLGLAFLGYAGYLMVAAPDDPFVTWLVFVTPVIGLVVAVTARRRARARLRRLEEEHSTKPYVGPEATVERQPYPSPPAPLDPSAPAPARMPPGPGGRTGGMPSGLPDAPPTSGLGQSPQEAAPRPPRPSGLPQMHAEPREPVWDAPPRPGSASNPPSFGAPSPRYDAAPPPFDAASPFGAAPPSFDAAPPSFDAASPSRSMWPPPAHPAPAHAEQADAGYRARHGAVDDQTAHHNYSGGRHRADGDN